MFLVPSAYNLCKQFEPTKCRAWSVSNLFDTVVVFLKEFFEKVYFQKNISRRQNSLTITQ